MWWKDVDEHSVELDVECCESGERYRVRVPWSSRAHWVGWGSRTRARWSGEDGSERVGVVTDAGPRGVTVVDHTGATHKLPSGTFQFEDPTVAQKKRGGRLVEAVKGLVDLVKGEAKGRVELQPGDRWITVHPNGAEPGNRIIIRPQADGTHRVVGGAGGALNHLVLTDVKSKEEYAKDEKERRGKANKARKDMRAREREREQAKLAGMTDEQRKAYHAQKKAERDAQKKAEQAYRKAQDEHVGRVRDSLGGVDDDLDPSELEGLGDKERARVLSKHRRKQIKQAADRLREEASKVAGERADRAIQRQAIEHAIEDQHGDGMPEEAVEAVEAYLDNLHAEERERKAARTAKRGATSGLNQYVSELAEQNTAEALEAKVDEVDEEFERDDVEGFEGPKESPSEEVKRRAGQEEQNAIVMYRLATGRDAGVPDEVAQSILEDALERELGDPSEVQRVMRDIHEEVGEDPGEVADAIADRLGEEALRREATYAARRAEIAEAEADKLAEMEKEDPAKAARRLAAADAVREVASTAREAEQMGLGQRGAPPMKEAELAEVAELVKDQSKLREMKSQFARMDKASTTKDFNAAREAFYLSATPATPEQEVSYQEAVQYELTNRLLGARTEGRRPYQVAVAAGHHNGFADAALGMTREALVDRVTVEALGVKNTAYLLRAQLEAQGVDVDAAREALEAYHIEQVEDRAAQALAKAEAILPGFGELVDGVDDLEHALSSLDVEQAAVDEASRAIGSALGNLEATAALSQAFRQDVPERMVLPADGNPERKVRELQALGLEAGDYTIDKSTDAVVVERAAWGKLVKRESAEVVQQRKDVEAIKRGEHDEEGWLPQGFVSRTASSFTDPTPDAERYYKPFNLDAEDVHGSVLDHVASRLADGEPAGSIYQDTLSLAGTHRMSPEQVRELEGALDHIFPKWDVDGAPDLQLGPTSDTLDGENALMQHEQAITALRAGHPSWKDRRDDIEAGLAHLEQRFGGEGDEADRVRQLRQAITDKDAASGLLTPGWARRKPAAWGQERQREIVDEWTAKQGGSPSIDGQSIDIESPDVKEAVYRALAEHPAAKHAFTPTAQLTSKHAAELRDHYYDMMGISDTRSFAKEFDSALDHVGEGESRSFRQKWKARGGQGDFMEPPRTIKQGGLFGGDDVEVENPDWKAWSKDAQKLAAGFPREGHAMMTAALGERPEAPRADRLSDEQREAIDVAVRRHWNVEDVGTVVGVLGSEGKIPSELHDVAKEYARQARHDNLVRLTDARKERAKTPWRQYVQMMGGREQALRGIQDHPRGQLAERFHEHHGRLTQKALRSGVTPRSESTAWAAATAAPQKRAEIQRQMREAMNRSQRRVRGRYAYQGGEGALVREVHSLTEEGAAQEQQQATMFGGGGGGGMGLFGGGGLFGNEPDEMKQAPAKAEGGPGDRFTIGAQAEAQIGAVVSRMGHQFDPKQPTKLFAGVNMDGKRIAQQRVIKQLRRVKRVGAFGGTGFGKTSTSIGGFTDLHADGEVSHGSFFVPKAVETNFPTEIRTFTEPGKYRFQTGDGLTHDQRVEALRHPENHMTIMTHQAARDTIVGMLAKHQGVEPEEALSRLLKTPPAKRAQVVSDAAKSHGIALSKHYSYLDEGHIITARGEGEGAESGTAAVLRAWHQAASYAMNGTGSPVKNEERELAYMASTLSPEQYGDEAAFMARHGNNLAHNPEAVRREMAHITYSEKIEPPVEKRVGSNPRVEDGKIIQSDDPSKLSDHQREETAKVEDAYRRVRAARDAGDVDVEAAKELSPGSFEGVPEHEHEQVARDVSAGAAMTREARLRDAVNLAPAEHNPKLQSMLDVIEHDLGKTWTDTGGTERKGRASIVFANSVRAAKLVDEQLQARGIRSGLYHGGLNTQERDKLRSGFQPGKDPDTWDGATHDVLVVTSSGEAGINLQRGGAIHHYDTPDTDKSWTQRNGRAHRQGQLGDVDIYDHHTESEVEKRARARLYRKRGLGEVFQTPMGALDDVGVAKHYNARISDKHQSWSPDELSEVA